MRRLPLWKLPNSQFRCYVTDHKLQQLSSTLSKNLKSIDQLTQQVERTIKDRKVEIETQNAKSELGKPDDDIAPLQDDDVNEIFDSLITENEVLSAPSGVHDLNLFPSPTPFVQLPDTITQAISVESIGKISSPANANWKPLLQELIVKTDSENLTLDSVSINPYEYHRLVQSIPKEQRGDVIDLLHQLAYQSGVVYDGKSIVANDLLSLCTHLEPKKADIVINKILEDMDTSSLPIKYETTNLDGIKPTKLTKCILINHYSRLQNVTNVKNLIDDLNTLPVELNPLSKTPIIYTNVMQMYMRMGNYHLAKETFDTMTFLSKGTSPSSRTYTSMILTDTLNNCIEHGLEVYQRMIDQNVKPEPDALLALAKGCGTRYKYKDGDHMILKGWSFIIEYYNGGYPINEKVMEIMMYLAYVDSDLMFARAIWMNVCEQKSRGIEGVDVSNLRLIKWLFNTYYKMGDGKECIAVMDDKVRTIRNRVIGSVDFTFKNNAPPLIPQYAIEKSMIMNEARAIWRYINNQQVYISPEIYEAYMYVLGRWGTMEEFKSEWQKRRFNNDRLYCMCLHVSRHNKNMELAKNVWEERGEYRLSEEFQKKSIKEQDQSDFKFARLMLSLFVTVGELDDAVKIVLSSKKRFKWEYYHLKSLIQLCDKLGANRMKGELLKVVR